MTNWPPRQVPLVRQYRALNVFSELNEQRQRDIVDEETTIPLSPTWYVEGLKHDLRSVLTVLRRVQRRLCLNWPRFTRDYWGSNEPMALPARKSDLPALHASTWRCTAPKTAPSNPSPRLYRVGWGTGKRGDMLERRGVRFRKKIYLGGVIGGCWRKSLITNKEVEIIYSSSSWSPSKRSGIRTGDFIPHSNRYKTKVYDDTIQKILYNCILYQKCSKSPLAY